MSRNLNTLIAQYYPEVAHAIQQRSQQELSSIQIPNSVLGRMEAGLERRGLDRPPTLQEMTDCFLVHFEKSTKLFPHASLQTSPPVSQYVELLKCQLLMERINNSSEMQNLPSISHWPGYVGALQEVISSFYICFYNFYPVISCSLFFQDLSQQCVRLQNELIAPDILHCPDEMLEIWTGDERNTSTPPQPTWQLYRDLLEL